MNKLITALAISSTLALAGCGGGGSSSASTPTSTSTAPTLSAADQALQNAGIPQVYWKQLEQVHADYAFSQKDSGAGVPLVFADQADLGKSTASELVNQPYFSGIDRFFNNGGSAQNLVHDQNVASIAAGTNQGIAQDSVIYNGSVTYLDAVNASNNSDLTAAAAGNGSAGVGGIINISYSVNGPNPLASVGQATSSPLASLASDDELLVQSAGDTAVPLCGGTNSRYLTGKAVGNVSCTDLSGDQTLNGAAPAFLDPRTKGNYLIVGETSVSTPGTPAPQGAYPGSDPGIEATFLVAPGYGVVAGNGTSYSAPMVSASAADIRAAYPSLTAAQVRKILLDSADTSFSNEYQKNNCGPSGTTNCGKYYFGVGMLNVEAALKLAGQVAAGSASP